MSFAYSNILAIVAVVCLPIVGGKWVAPKLSIATKRCFFTFSLWGIPYVIGQCAQEDEWGSLWVQYHLLDLSYAPWGTALVMCALPLGAAFVGKDVSGEKAFAVGLCAIIAFGHASEIWDTAWALSGGEPLGSAIDSGDYATITYGVVIAAVSYLGFQKTAPKWAMG